MLKNTRRGIPLRFLIINHGIDARHRSLSYPLDQIYVIYINTGLRIANHQSQIKKISDDKNVYAVRRRPRFSVFPKKSVGGERSFSQSCRIWCSILM